MMAEYGDEALEEVDEDDLAQLIIEYDEALEEIDEDDLAQMLADYEDEALPMNADDEKILQDAVAALQRNDPALRGKFQISEP